MVTTPPPEEIYLFIQNAQLFLAAYIKSLNHNSKFKNVECLALNRDTRLTWWCMLLIPAFERQRQIDLYVLASLVYIASSRTVRVRQGNFALPTLPSPPKKIEKTKQGNNTLVIAGLVLQRHIDNGNRFKELITSLNCTESTKTKDQNNELTTFTLLHNNELTAFKLFHCF